MSHRYVIDVGREGGEVKICRVPASFVEYWKDRDEYELVDFVRSQFSGDGSMPEWSDLQDRHWTELDSLISAYGVSNSSEWQVHAVRLLGNAAIADGGLIPDEDLGYRRSFEREEVVAEGDYDSPVWRVDRHLRFEYELSDDNAMIPVLLISEVEEGDFGQIFIESDKAFDPALFGIGVVGGVGECVVESFWYEGKPLQYDADDITQVTGLLAYVGYVSTDSIENCRPAD